MRLFLVEMRRMRARRLNVVLFATVLLGIAVASTIVFFKTSTDVEAATAKARLSARLDYQDCLAHVGPDFQSPPPGAPPEKFEHPCGELDPSQITADPLFHMRSYLDVVKGTAAPMIVLALVLGASFVGAEWHHRTITTTLTWESRRQRLLLAKALACAAVIFLSVVTLQAVLGLALIPAASAHGDFAGTSGAWLRSVVGAVLRSASAAAMASVIGLSIATIGRHTVAAVGVAFAYFAVVENLVRNLKPKWQPWLLGDNAVVFVSGDRFSAPAGRTVLAAGMLIALYAAGSFISAAGAFRARDVA